VTGARQSKGRGSDLRKVAAKAEKGGRRFKIALEKLVSEEANICDLWPGELHCNRCGDGAPGLIPYYFVELQTSKRKGRIFELWFCGRCWHWMEKHPPQMGKAS